MPTISVQRQDLMSLIAGAGKSARPMTLEQLEGYLPLVKGELKGQQAETGEIRIELQDSNRPDLWSCEGIARQIRAKQLGRLSPYPFFKTKKRPSRRVVVAQGVESVRPFVAACIARGATVSERGLVQLIQTQEKLADIYGRKRRTVSIGLYRLPAVAFPVVYELVKREEVRFIPLGMDTMMTLGEILMVHPKGLEYGAILSSHERVPILRDSAGQVLSFPPIINSREIGELKVGDREVFVEVTGTDLPMVILTLNILAANLADRGATIEPVEVQYPDKTAFGKTLVLPIDIGTARAIPLKTFTESLGETLSQFEITQALKSYGYDVTATRHKAMVKLPPYRNDLMHAVDVVEDVAISRGYDRFAPVMPSQFSVGGVTRTEQLSDRIRDLMVGMGYQEIMSNILSSRQDLCTLMRVEGTPWAKLVEVENVMSLCYSALRQWIVPSLLRVEAASSRAFYPHRVFEIGEVAVPDDRHGLGARTSVVLGALIAHAGANFSEIHSSLDLLFYYLGRSYMLDPLQHPSFLEGRAGQIMSEGKLLGLVGELHPEVLERWQIGMPSVAFEVDLMPLTHSPT